MEALTKSRTSTPYPFDADRHESEEKLHLFEEEEKVMKEKRSRE